MEPEVKKPFLIGKNHSFMGSIWMQQELIKIIA